MRSIACNKAVLEGGACVLNRKIKTAIYALGLIVTMTTSVIADPLSDKLKDQQKVLDQNKDALKDTQNKRKDLEKNIQLMDAQIEGLMAQISGIKVQIDKTQQDIKDAQKEVDKAQGDIDEEQKLFDSRMKAMYINGSSGYLDVLISSKDMGDFISRMDYIQKIAEWDNSVIKELDGKKQELNKKKDDLDSQNKKLLSLKADNEQKASTLNGTMNSQKKLVADLQAQENTYSAKIDDNQAAIDATKKQLAELAAKAAAAAKNTTVASRGTTGMAQPYSTDAVVLYAYQFIGRPYVWAANGPESFDCSGFVRYVYAHFGVSFDNGGVRRSTYDMITQGTPVSRNALQPGDVIYFGTQTNPHHVGIYVGNNCFIHAPQTGDRVKISSLDGSDYLTARRMR